MAQVSPRYGLAPGSVATFATNGSKFKGTVVFWASDGTLLPRGAGGSIDVRARSTYVASEEVQPSEFERVEVEREETSPAATFSDADWKDLDLTSPGPLAVSFEVTNVNPAPGAVAFAVFVTAKEA